LPIASGTEQAAKFLIRVRREMGVGGIIGLLNRHLVGFLGGNFSQKGVLSLRFFVNYCF